MNRLTLSATVVAAIGLAMSLQGCMTSSEKMADDKPQVVKDTEAKLAAGGFETCFGVNAVGKNDCAAGAHACAGMATKANDPGSFVVVPTGACSKIAGGHTSAS
ncbi:MAG TPA: DUF2282 domain-containing protein [Candidatus Binatia bacterium]|nr:DUF2282 domain-containing protein [Candidatus Binatia bacterium]